MNSSIQSAAGITLGTAALGLTSERAFGANNKVVLGLIGAGPRGSLLAEGRMKDAKNVETKYVCEVDDTRGHGVIRNIEKCPKEDHQEKEVCSFGQEKRLLGFYLE